MRSKEPEFKPVDRFGVQIEHRNGIPWFAARLPRRWHRCSAWTRGWVGLDFHRRCACGAKRINDGDWFDRNQRRERS